MEIKMKQSFLISIFLFVFILSFSQTHWRKGEMEAKIVLYSQDDVATLSSLKLNGDVYQDHALVYIVPEELEILRSTNLDYKITIKDLNKHSASLKKNLTEYHSYQEIIDLMDSLVTHFPDICKKEVYGTSIEGRELSALKISDSVQYDQTEPEIAFDGSIHGDEIGGAENLVRFARMLCLEYGNDPYITDLIDNREIWIYCLANPDGFEAIVRYNSNGVDLNRDWGYMWDAWGYSTGAYSQPESKALRDFMLENHFNIHITYHSGTEAYLYPWYYRSNPCAEDAENVFLGQLYSSNSGYADLEYFPGYQLYPTNGTTAETSYGVMGNYGVVVELSYNKQPPPSQIMHYYNINEPSMLLLIEYAGYGLSGIVTDEETGNPIQAVIFIEDMFPVYTDSITGDYQKFLLSGNYSATAVASGYESKTIDNITVNDLEMTTVNFGLSPVDTPNQYGYRVISCQIPGNNFMDEGNTPAVIGAPDNIYYSIGKNGWIVIDMQMEIFDLDGNDINVFEGDITQEGYIIYAATSMDGPWIQMGTGNGTQEFDIQSTGLEKARFFKIKDDGDGAASVDDAGFDLDAISAPFRTWGVQFMMEGIVIDDTSGNGNGRFDPGETANLCLEIKNIGNKDAINATGTLSSASGFVTITEPVFSFGNIPKGQTAEGIYSIEIEGSTPPGEMISFELNVVSNGGLYTSSFAIDFSVGQLPVIIVDLDKNNNSGPAMQTAIEELDVPVVYTTTFPEELELYKCTFLCLGISNQNHILTNSQGEDLAQYLEKGGRLYMEGGNTWKDDQKTVVHQMFGITPAHTGFNDLGLIFGQDEAFTDDMIFPYSGDNNSIDRIVIDGPNAFEIFRNQVPSYCTSIANEQDGYKTIGSSFEFGGLQDGQSSKTVLMEAILEFFGGIITGQPDLESSGKNIDIYPNPASNRIFIDLNLENNHQLIVDFFNLNGQQVSGFRHNSASKVLSLSVKGDLKIHEPGLYFYKITFGNHKLTGKIMIIQ